MKRLFGVAIVALSLAACTTANTADKEAGTEESTGFFGLNKPAGP